MDVYIKQPVVLEDENIQHLKVVQNYIAHADEGADDPLSIIGLQLNRLFKEFGNGPHFDKFESLVVHQAFSHAESNQVHGAALLGISRNVMRTLLKRHGLLGNRNNYKALNCSNDSEIDNLNLNRD